MIPANRESLCLAVGRLFPGWADRQLRQPIFLIGVARSGTTVLANLLGRHPAIANWSELNHLWDPRGYPWDESDHARPPDWADPHGYARSWWADTPPAYRRAIRRALGAYQGFARRRVLLNKSPMHTFRVPQILEMIPEARFIYLVRDGRAVVYSYASKIAPKIKNTPGAYAGRGLALQYDELILALARHWQAAQAQFEQYRFGLRADQLLGLRYEDLCSDPRPALNSIFEFAGVPPERFDWQTTRVLADRNDKWREGLPEPVWKAAQQIMVEGLAGWGYSAA